MSDYTPPLDDIEFVLRHVVGLESISKLNGFQHADPDTAIGVLGEAGRFFSEVIAPTNSIGDTQGSRLDESGSVVTPDGFKEAYDKFVAAGWPAVHLPEQAGGGGFPYAVGIAIQEMFTSANMAFSLAPLLTQGAIDALIEHGSPQQQELYLEKLATGQWTGTMCLTEPQAGSDLGAVATRAVHQNDGSYRITGQKIFITWGDHDLTENVIHLVLAKTPGSASGTRGISMFIVPKFIPQQDGTPGERNDVTVVSLEHKLGIHASPTCVLSFGDSDGAVGYLVGEEGRGMKYMFTMMNSARIGVAVEGLAIGEMAYQKAVKYATERVQSKPIGGDSSATIIKHPDIRRTLLTMRANNEAMRAALYDTAAKIDVENHGDNEEDRASASERVALMIPILKAWCTDLGVEIASLGVQVHGGMGYIEETGAAQFLRDSRIAPIYEGTNGIQSLDLVTRKIPLRDGAVVKEYLEEMTSIVSDLRALADFDSAADQLDRAIEALASASAHVGERMSAGAFEDAVAGATPFTRMWGTVVGGVFLAKSAIAAHGRREHGDSSAAIDTKPVITRFYCEHIVPTAVGLLPSILAPASALFELDEAQLTG